MAAPWRSPTASTRSPTRPPPCRWAPAASPQAGCPATRRPDDVRALRRHVRTEVARTVGEFSRFGPPDRVVATSKTFKQLARIAGAARSAEGLYVQRELKRKSLEEWVPRLAGMTEAERAELPGVSEGRAGQLLAGALVAEAAMDLFGVERLEICPWALREGVILRRLDHMESV
ncbi:hypothetical protein STAFG_6782 [Streptomyces afghaniensis 772]|uniref:Ppx/GppA phosphatase N-terminal domain-containing protein n=1 Tax=Streptomyces afghaniensis 772 TaxID=1283301 RepID=S4MRI1_9ACTN|nr:hypothetical protein STAFG_6782 [Streptomyces afghaniensis 772]